MKVAIFTETYLPYINGVVTHISILKEGLEKMGHEVLIVTADPDTHRHYVKDDVLHCPAHESKRLYGYGLALPLSQRRLKLVKQFRPDIIHIHQEFGVGFSGILIAKILHVPIVYTMHTMYDEYLYYIAPQKLLPLVRRIAHSYSRMIARSASAITGPSAKIQEYFTEVGVEKHVNVIPNPVELDMFNPDNITAEQRAEIRRKHNIPDHKMIACFVGRLGKEKSVDLLFDYWAEEIKPEDDIHLIIIGDGPSRPELEQQAKDLGIDKMITFTGAIMHNEMPPTTLSAIFTSPLHFPIPVQFRCLRAWHQVYLCFSATISLTRIRLETA